MSNQKQTVSSNGSLPDYVIQAALPTWGRAGVGLRLGLSLHYLKIAFRNLRKYKTQNTISIIGLAVGFACFALSLFWIQFEQSFDHFHPNADRIYRVRHIKNEFQADSLNPSFDRYTAYPLADLLKSSFPEIDEAGRVEKSQKIRLKSGKTYDRIVVDSSFCKIFDIRVDAHFFAKGLGYMPVMITEKAARDIFGKINVVGDTLEDIWGKKQIVHRVIKEWPSNTEYKFDLLFAVDNFETEDIHQWGYLLYDTYLLVSQDIDITSLENKIRKLTYSRSEFLNPTKLNLIITPLKDLHTKKPDDNVVRNVKLSHISIFILSGIFIILCALFNYLSLFLSLIQMRGKEFALRKVNGSSTIQIIGLLLFEFLLILLVSIVAGYIIITICVPKFKELAMMELSRLDILVGTASYSASLFLCVLLVCMVPIWYFNQKTLNLNITGGTPSMIKNGFRKISLLAQLIIGIGFMFCVVIFFMQIHHLRHSDLGFERRNIATVTGNEWSRLNTFQYKDKIKQIPFVTEVLQTPYPQFIKQMSGASYQTSVEKNGEEVNVIYDIIDCESRFFEFYNMKLIEGRLLNDSETNCIIINEKAAKLMEEGAIGKLIGGDKIIGIVKDFYYESPTTPVKPTIIQINQSPIGNQKEPFRGFVYKYQEGHRKETETVVKELIHSDYPNEDLVFIYSEDEYDKYLQSEKSLSILLGFVTFACILIAIFGVYSLASLSCEQRRREIAIRKVNGAEVLNIMNIFFKEYLLLLALAALVAFPAGYIIMKRWLAGYVKQTSLDAWLFVLIFLIVFVVIVFSIISMVWKAANQNPAEVVKSE